MAERWDRDRFERARGEQSGSRFDDDRSYTRSTRGRDHSDERHDRRPGRGYYDEDDMVRDRRYYGDEPRYPQPERERERDAPPPWARRTDVLERERERDYPRRASPPRRPGFLRRQSSLDTFDRRPGFLHHREEYPAPARREDVRPRDHRDPRDDYRPPPYVPIPLPKSRGLPPPRKYGDEHYDDIKIAEPDYYGDEDYRSMPERVREKEYTRSRKSRGRSRDSRSTRTRSVRSESVSSSSRSSSSSGGTTVKSEYPKKGKTRIPAKLVSKRALIDLGYPFFEEGNTIIVQKALGQDNIDELLKVSEDYKKVEAEIAASRAPKAPTAALPPPPPTEREPTPEPPPAKTPPPPPPPVQQAPPPVQQAPPVQAPPVQLPPMQQAPPPPMPPQMMPTPAPPPPMYMQPPMHMQPPPMQTPMPPMAQPGPPPTFYQPGPPPPQTAYDYEETVIREVSPSRSSTTMTSYDSYHRDSYHHHHHQPEELIVRARSQSRNGRDIRKEIKALERELAHRPRGRSTSGDIVRAERLPDGQLIIREERLEKVVEHRKPPRIEKDKKGRMAISVPKYR